jgi:hypothetical protein
MNMLGVPKYTVNIEREREGVGGGGMLKRKREGGTKARDGGRRRRGGCVRGCRRMEIWLGLGGAGEKRGYRREKGDMKVHRGP